MKCDSALIVRATRINICRGRAAKSSQQLRNPRPSDSLQGPVHVDRRNTDGNIFVKFNLDASRANRDKRPEIGIDASTDEYLADA